MHICQHSFKKIPSNLWVVRVGYISFQEISYIGKVVIILSYLWFDYAYQCIKYLCFSSAILHFASFSQSVNTISKHWWNRNVMFIEMSKLFIFDYFLVWWHIDLKRITSCNLGIVRVGHFWKCYGSEASKS